MATGIGYEVGDFNGSTTRALALYHDGSLGWTPTATTTLLPPSGESPPALDLIASAYDAQSNLLSRTSPMPATFGNGNGTLLQRRTHATQQQHLRLVHRYVRGGHGSHLGMLPDRRGLGLLAVERSRGEIPAARPSRLRGRHHRHHDDCVNNPTPEIGGAGNGYQCCATCPGQCALNGVCKLCEQPQSR